VNVSIAGGTFFLCLWLFIIANEIGMVKRSLRSINESLVRIAVALEVDRDAS